MRAELGTEPTEVSCIGKGSNAGIPPRVDGTEHRTPDVRFSSDHDPPGPRWRRCVGRRPLHAGRRKQVFEDAVQVESHNFHYHLNELVDVGLVDKRTRRTPDKQSFYTYYRPTAMGDVIFEHGVEELMRREREFNDAYGVTRTCVPAA